jgi:hypothetical protein
MALWRLRKICIFCILVGINAWIGQGMGTTMKKKTAKAFT